MSNFTRGSTRQRVAEAGAHRQREPVSQQRGQRHAQHVQRADGVAREEDGFASGSLAVHAPLSSKLVLGIDLPGKRADRGRSPRTAVAPMALIPAQNVGNFFNRQSRSTTTMQWVQSMTGSYDWGRVSHLFKAGFDVMRAVARRQQQQRPGVSGPRRPDAGAIAGLQRPGVAARDQHGRRAVRAGPSAAAAAAAAGIRRSASTATARPERVNATPRLGAVLPVTPRGTAAIRAGAGLFVERTPSIAGAFDQLDMSTETPLRRRRDDAARPPVLLPSRDGARSPGRAQRHLERAMPTSG